VQVSWKEERKKCRIPFFQSLNSAENPASYLISSFPHDTACTNHGRRLNSAEIPASYLISFFPHDTACTNHGKKREKYGQAFHFSKPPSQDEEKIS
jgi:hypothetical protein